MSKVRVSAFTISLDGYGAGVKQDLQKPMGIGGEGLHQWMFPTKMFQQMMGKTGGTEGKDNEFAEQSMQNIGAWIMGRNMFAHSRGPWTDDDWKGWWGSNPPYHVPVYVLTNYARPPLEMEGGTVFHFITEGIHAAHELAQKAANGKDIRIGGGTSTVRQYLQAGLIDEMHFAISPVFLGAGEHLLSGIDLLTLGFTDTKVIQTENATHVVTKKKG
jgi:dihydrofolate reductase